MTCSTRNNIILSYLILPQSAPLSWPSFPPTSRPDPYRSPHYGWSGNSRPPCGHWCKPFAYRLPGEGLGSYGARKEKKKILLHFSWWRHQMEKNFPRYWSFVQGIHRWPVNSPHKDQRRGALMFSMIFAWINGWVNTREAGDLRRHGTHYDVIAIFIRRSFAFI